jgi:hypothetical protein
MAKRQEIRREPCPDCGTAGVLVTHELVINGSGRVAADAPIKAACPNRECSHYDRRVDPDAEDPNEAAARTVREATEGK